jgi:YidC/Oxa1 family membrane protein insertase
VDTLLEPLYEVVSWILIAWHWLFAAVLPDGGAWLLSIIGLVVVIRTLLIPLFVKQIRSSRSLQLLQPQMRELQKKYGHDKQRLQQEMMQLYKDTGTNPFASCLPILLQMPFFFALFQVLNGASTNDARGAFTSRPDLFESFADAQVAGIRLSDSFKLTDDPTTRVVAMILVIIMVATTFITQRQLMRKNMPASALEGPYAQQQKLLLYILPFTFLFSGFFFPIGVVVYWCVSNLWTMGQQFYVIRNMPAPGTPAEEAYRRRQEAKAVKKGRPVGDVNGKLMDSGRPIDSGKPMDSAHAPQPPPVKRVQPKRQTRAQRRNKK